MPDAAFYWARELVLYHK